MISLLIEFKKELISLALTLVSSGIVYLFRPRTKLVWSSAHSFTFLLHQPQGGSFNVHTASIYFANVGRVPATDVEVTFNFKPENLNLWPVRPHDVHQSPDGRYSLKFANLAPKEGFQIELLSSMVLYLHFSTSDARKTSEDKSR